MDHRTKTMNMIEKVGEAIEQQERLNSQIQYFDYSVEGAPLFVIRDLLKSPDAAKQEIWRGICEDEAHKMLARIKMERKAKAAIEALRDPTPDMLIASGCIEGYDDDSEFSQGADQDHINWWQSMLEEAALQETDSE